MILWTFSSKFSDCKINAFNMNDDPLPKPNMLKRVMEIELRFDFQSH